MAVQPLDEVQRRLVNEDARPLIEALILAHHRLQNFRDNWANQQTPIVVSADDLGDDATGTAPRSDAPVLTGDLLNTLDGLAAARLLSGPQYNSLVQHAVRTVDQIVGNER